MNRILAVCMAAIWSFPVWALFDLPQQRARNYSQVVDSLLRFTEALSRGAQRAMPSFGPGMAQTRQEAAAMVANPELVESAMLRGWLLELGAFIVGAVGVLCLWFRPRYWRIGALAGVVAFVATSGLFEFGNLLLMTIGSPNALASVFRLVAQTPSSAVTDFATPVILIPTALYAVWRAGRPPGNAQSTP